MIAAAKSSETPFSKTASKLKSAASATASPNFTLNAIYRSCRSWKQSCLVFKSVIMPLTTSPLISAVTNLPSLSQHRIFFKIFICLVTLPLAADLALLMTSISSDTIPSSIDILTSPDFSRCTAPSEGCWEVWS